MTTLKNSFTLRYLIVVTAILLLVLFSYWPSFSVPFYLDDQNSIVDNSVLLNGDIYSLFHHYKMRFIGYLSFWINHQWFAGSLFSYHIVNLSIHLSNGVLIYFIVKQLAIYYGQLTTKQAINFALTVTAIWLVHPLNTQAVTYVVQRLAALSTLFVLFTLLSYLTLRVKGCSWQWVTVLFCSIVLGALTKQSYFAVFVFIALFEVCIIRQYRQNMYVSLLTGCFLMALFLPCYPELITKIELLTKETQAITRAEYFTAQLTVLWLYVGKLFLPINLQLDMGVELVKQSTGLQFFALLCHCLLICVALKIRRVVPLFTVGILWFYAGHSVESFVIPITDLAFEHRTYFPNIGLILAVCALFHYSLINHIKNFKAIAVMIVLLLSLLTLYRNIQWQSPFDFYQNELVLSPNSSRSKESFAVQLIARGDLAQGQSLLLDAVNQNFRNNKVTLSSLNNLMAVLFQRGHYQTGVQTAMKSLKYVRNNKERSNMLTTTAYGYIKMGLCGFATGLAKRAVKLDSNNVQAKEYIELCNNKK